MRWTGFEMVVIADDVIDNAGTNLRAYIKNLGLTDGLRLKPYYH